MSIKTHKGASKRLKVTGSKKLMYKSGGMAHLLTGKKRSRKNRLKKESYVTKTKADKLITLIQA